MDTHPIGAPPTFIVPSVSTSGTMSHSTDSIALSVQGRNFASIGFDDQTALTGTLGVLVTNGSGSTEYRVFWDGNRYTATSVFPNGTGSGEKGVSFSIPLLSSDRSLQLFAWSYTSGSVNATITADHRIEPVLFNPSLGLDGGNPAGAASESPGSLSIGGKDASVATIHRTASYDRGGRAITRPWGPIDWSNGAAPAVGSIASYTRAPGGAGVKHIATGITVCLSVGTIAAATASPVVLAVLRDGASGSGAVQWGAIMSVPAAAGSSAVISQTGLNIRGSSNQTMTLEFNIASGASIQQSVWLTGVDVTE